MSILSSSVSISRYRVKGDLQEPILENVHLGLKKNCITDIDNKPLDRSVGWTCFNDPFNNTFNRSSFLIGTNIVFSMRIDKKNIPIKVIDKAFAAEVNIRLKKMGRNFLSKQEKKDIRDNILYDLSLKVPSVPSVYDVIWQYEEKMLLFFSNLINPNEELETLFYNSFDVSLIKLFPFTMADTMLSSSNSEKDILVNLSPTSFTGEILS